MRSKIEVHITMLAALFVGFCLPVHAQEAGAIVKPVQESWEKAENGMLFSWHRGVSADAASSRINIYDLQGNLLTSFTVLQLVPEAENVSIDDVSAQNGQMVVVAAVYIKQQDHSPAAVLLYLDFKGTLVSALALAPSREVDALVIDDRLNVWTLTHSAADDDPARSPLVVEYSSTGQVVRELLTRTLFPPHERRTLQNSQIGSPAVGIDKGTFWVWLPASTDFVTIRTEDGAVLRRQQTGIPQIAGKTVWPLQVVAGPSGVVAAEFHVQSIQTPAYYVWSADSKSWSSFNPDSCKIHRLIGVNNNSDLIFLGHEPASTRNTICLQSASSVTNSALRASHKPI